MANNISNISENIQFFGMLVLEQLRAKLALLGFVANDYPGASDAAAAGSIINIPSIAISGSARTRAINGAIVTDDFSSSSVAVTLEQVYKSVKVDNLQRTFSGNMNVLQKLAERMAIILADGVDAKLTDLWYKIPYEVGKADGNGTFNSTDNLNTLAAARKVLTVNKAPMDRLQAVIGPTEAYNIRTLAQYNQASLAGTSEGRETGNLGRVSGFNMRESQSAPTSITLATTSAWGTPLVNSSACAIGDVTLPVDGLAASGVIKKGSVFSVGSNNYSVTADVTASSGAATLAITPALKTAPANDDPITFASAAGTNGLIGGHSAAGSVGFAYDPDAFLLVVRPQAAFIEGSGVRSFDFSDPESGLAFRLNIESRASGAAGTAMQETLTADLLCGAQVVRPELACRISGQV